MNYYPFHLGDYATNTAHLEPMEDLAYRRMLDLYYRTESPLPKDATELARLIRLRDHAAAVSDVLTEFFDATPDGWRHKRCDKEIGKYMAMADGGRKGAAVRWGRAGDAPPIGLAMAPLIDPQCQPEPRTKNQNQEPRTKNHQPPGGAPPDPPAPAALSGRSTHPTDAGRACLACRGANVHDVNPSHPDLLRLLAAGVTPEEIGSTAAECSAKGKPRFAYVLATVERRRIEAAQAPQVAAARPVTVPSTDRQAEAFHAAMDERAATATRPPAAIMAMAGRIGR